MATQHISLTVNGRRVEQDVDERMTLADFLRGELGLVGAHLGCEHGVCGSCTILMDGASIRSCIALAAQADGAELETVEGLAGPDGELHPLQEAFWEQHGLQCGFCTPGMLMRSLELIRENPELTREQAREGIASNLCRCTGYQFIVDAVVDGAERMRDADLAPNPSTTTAGR
jgi:aerobic carbon-monoxide dehydrogenase small subunit